MITNKKTIFALMALCFHASLCCGTQEEFFSAIASNSVERVQQLIESGDIDVNCKDLHQWPALCIAASRGHIEVAELLLRAGADKEARDCGGNTALVQAIFNRHAQIVELLLRAGVQVNAQDNVGRTALMWAASGAYRNQEIRELLLRNGADIASKDSQGKAADDYAREPKPLPKFVSSPVASNQKVFLGGEY